MLKRNDSIFLHFCIYDPGAHVCCVTIIWRVPDERVPIELITTGARLLKVEGNLPVYHIRQRHHEFSCKNMGKCSKPCIT